MSELHASQESHTACIYSKTIKSKFKGGYVSAYLIASKYRMAPKKEATIQKLELLGNFTLRRLIKPAFKALSWTDSKFTVVWISAVHKEYNSCIKSSVRDTKNRGCF